MYMVLVQCTENEVSMQFNQVYMKLQTRVV